MNDWEYFKSVNSDQMCIVLVTEFESGCAFKGFVKYLDATDILYIVIYYSVYKRNINHKMAKFQLIIWRHVSAIQ